jgi:hypothetical protein
VTIRALFIVVSTGAVVDTVAGVIEARHLEKYKVLGQMPLNSSLKLISNAFASKTNVPNMVPTTGFDPGHERLISPRGGRNEGRVRLISNTNKEVEQRAKPKNYCGCQESTPLGERVTPVTFPPIFEQGK